MSEALDGIKARVSWTKQVPTVSVAVVQLCDYIAAMEELVIPITHSLTKVSDKATAAVENLVEIGETTTATLEAQGARIADLEQLIAAQEERHTREIKNVEEFAVATGERTKGLIEVAGAATSAVKRLRKRIAAIEERNAAIDLMQGEAMKEDESEPS